MSIDLARELIDAGLATGVNDVEELHRTDGPAALTACCRAGTTLVWVEHEHALSGQADDQRRVGAALDPVLRRLGLRTVGLLPRITDQGSAVYPDVPGSSLLVDALLPTGPIAIAPTDLLEVSERLGAFLAQLHSAQQAEIPRVLLRGSAAVQSVAVLASRRRAAAPSTLGLEHVQEALMFEHADLGGALAAACSRFDRCRASVLLHGRFCPGFVVTGASGGVDALRVIGWTAAGFGPAEFDVGWCIAEFEELASARGKYDLQGAELLRDAASAVLRTYIGEPGTFSSSGFLGECSAYAAVKVVAHLAEYAQHFAIDRGAVEDQLNLAARIMEPTWAESLIAGGRT